MTDYAPRPDSMAARALAYLCETGERHSGYALAAHFGITRADMRNHLRPALRHGLITYTEAGYAINRDDEDDMPIRRVFINASDASSIKRGPASVFELADASL